VVISFVKDEILLRLKRGADLAAFKSLLAQIGAPWSKACQSSASIASGCFQDRMSWLS